MKRPGAPKPESALPRWRIIAIRRKGEQLTVVRAKDAASAVADYAREHDADPTRLMALPFEGD